MSTTIEPLSSIVDDEYAEDLNSYFGDNPNKGLYGNHLS
jgi:hypothetical protein